MDDLVAARDAETVTALGEAVELLRAAYATARADLTREAEAFGGAPEQMRDASGRFILLDALTAIVQARAALVYAEGP